MQIRYINLTTAPNFFLSIIWKHGKSSALKIKFLKCKIESTLISIYFTFSLDCLWEYSCKETPIVLPSGCESRTTDTAYRQAASEIYVFLVLLLFLFRIAAQRQTFFWVPLRPSPFLLFCTPANFFPPNFSSYTQRHINTSSFVWHTKLIRLEIHYVFLKMEMVQSVHRIFGLNYYLPPVY